MNEKIPASLKNKWNEICSQAQLLSFRKGQTLFYEGHAPYGVFVIKSGKVQYSQGGNACAQEHIWNSPQGEVIGLYHLFSNTPYCCTGNAASDCETLFVSKTQLAHFLNH